jgi:cation diffusion facilitator CzcD-associated flavoprotein CzcO
MTTNRSTAGPAEVPDPTDAGDREAVASPREHLDVLVIGAGLSGIDAAHHLVTTCPWATFAVFEGRDRIGGTWDLFRYPGIRSDSDMFTFSYPWRPWPLERTIGRGEEIRQYIEDTAREDGTWSRIRFGHRVVRAEWSTEDARWTVTAERAGEHGGQVETFELTAGFIFSCTGYYRYDRGYVPDWDGMADYEGRVIHPQDWPEDADLSNRRIVVIGSGATAVTLVPELAKVASHVTMLQRSPTYMISLPTTNLPTKVLSRILPRRWRGDVLRWQYVAATLGMYKVSRAAPGLVRSVLRRQLRAQLPAGFDVERHFSPRYDPWDQRLCVVTDGDLFAAIRNRSVDVVTDHIERFTPTGVQLRSGATLDAEVVITATGLDIQIGGGSELFVDGDKVDPSTRLTYKGSMLEGVPNLAMVIGYANASWTLKSDLTCRFIARVLDHMHRTGNRRVTAVNSGGEVADGNLMGLTSGYIVRADDRLPRQGRAYPWRNHQSYTRDYRALHGCDVVDDVLRYG